MHECTRQFSDRLINEDDKEWFRGKLAGLLRDNMGHDLDTLV